MEIQLYRLLIYNNYRHSKLNFEDTNINIERTLRILKLGKHFSTEMVILFLFSLNENSHVKWEEAVNDAIPAKFKSLAFNEDTVSQPAQVDLNYSYSKRLMFEDMHICSSRL